MRDISEYTAEVFSRSKKRIEKRKKIRNRVISLCIPLCLAVTVLSVTVLPELIQFDEKSGGAFAEDTAGSTDKNFADMIPGGSAEIPDIGSVDSFSFSLSWDYNGISHYDSATGELVKTRDATNPDEYVTTYKLTKEQKQDVYNQIAYLDITSYPDQYDPHGDGLVSNPSMTLVLSVKTDKLEKTVRAANVPLTYESSDGDGQRFLITCKNIIDILTETEEWKALPDYEFFYH